MLTVLLGQDFYSKQEYLLNLIQEKGLEVTRFTTESDLPKLSSLGGLSLFGAGGAYVFWGCLAKYELDELEKAMDSQAQIYFLEDSLDKRTTKTKELLKLAEVKEFPAPDSSQADTWIINHAKQMSIDIEAPAVHELVRRILGQTKTHLPVVMVHHELLKLSALAGDSVITKDMVTDLTPEDMNIDLFVLLDLIGTNQKTKAIQLLQHYYEHGTEDEKAQTIRLVALLSDQLRSLLIAKELLEQGRSDVQILETTGWKSGRLFVMKKLSRNFTISQLKSALTKFYSLDKELKTSTLPPRVIVDMIVASL